MTLSERELQKILSGNPDLVLVDEWDIGRNPGLPSTKTRSEKEHEMQVAVIEACNVRAVLNPDWKLIFAIPNGGHRHPVVGAKLKAEGVKKGVLDLFVPLPRHSRHGCFIECKADDNRPSEEQRWWIRQLLVQGYACEVFYDDPDKVIDYLEWWIER